MEILSNCKLSRRLFEQLDERFPHQDETNNSIRDRAVEIVRFFLLTQNKNTRFYDRPKKKGADLSYEVNNEIINIEIKGTKDDDISWDKLKVSGKPSCKGIKDGWPVYRVTGVFNSNPRIYVLKHKVDFELIREPRWRFRKI